METINGWLVERASIDNSAWYARRVDGSRKYRVSYSLRGGIFHVRNDLGEPISTRTGIGAGAVSAVRLSKQWIRDG